MRVIVTGGAGFIGTLLARRLLAGSACIGGVGPADVGELVIADLAAPTGDVAADSRTRAVAGDLAAVIGGLGEADVIFHLAGVVSGAAEADFDLGMRVNVDGTRAVLEHARRHARPPVLVFSSSIAVFGTDPTTGAVDVVRDDTLPRPHSSSIRGVYARSNSHCKSGRQPERCGFSTTALLSAPRLPQWKPCAGDRHAGCCNGTDG